MNDFLNELADYLEDQTVGTVATDIFIGEVPGSPNALVCLLGLPGAGLTASRDVAALQFPRFQAYVRAVSYDDASDKFQAVRTALHGLLGHALPHWRILRCFAESEGGPIGSDEQGRFEFSINFAAEIDAETTP